MVNVLQLQKFQLLRPHHLRAHTHTLSSHASIHTVWTPCCLPVPYSPQGQHLLHKAPHFKTAVVTVHDCCKDYTCTTAPQVRYANNDAANLSATCVPYEHTNHRHYCTTRPASASCQYTAPNSAVRSGHTLRTPPWNGSPWTDSPRASDTDA